MTQTSAHARMPVRLEGVEHDCGGHFELLEERRDVIIGQNRAPVVQLFYRCDGCAEERQTLEQMAAARRAAAAELRSHDHLLSGADIRRIREERLRVTQSLLEKALGLGEKTVVRWETERVLQPKSTDNLLRLLDRDPDALRFLAEMHGVELPPGAPMNAERVRGEMDTPCSLPIPRSYLTRIEQAAADEGLTPENYVVWLLAERFATVHLSVPNHHPAPKTRAG